LVVKLPIVYLAEIIILILPKIHAVSILCVHFMIYYTMKFGLRSSNIFIRGQIIVACNPLLKYSIMIVAIAYLLLKTGDKSIII